MLLLFQEELKSALKAKDKATLTALRNIIGKLKIRQINKGEDLTQQECIQVLQSSVKQLKDSIIQYEKGGRDDLAEVETVELKLIEQYLPEQLSEHDLRALVRKTIESIRNIFHIESFIINHENSGIKLKVDELHLFQSSNKNVNRV